MPDNRENKNRVTAAAYILNITVLFNCKFFAARFF
jgi:hypothetical protein